MDVQGFVGDYSNPNSGLNINNAWINIVVITYSPNKYILMPFDVYLSEQDYQNGKSPVTNDRKEVSFGTNTWNSFFSVDVMNQPNKNILKQVLVYLEQIYPNTSRKSI